MSRSRPLTRPHAGRLARSFARIPCQVVRERDFRLVADRIVDLSDSGAMVAPADPVLTGETVIVSFLGRSGWVDAEARVARVVHGRRRGEHTRALGLSFEHLDDASRAALAEQLKRAVPVPPGNRSERRAAPRAL